MKKDHLLLMLFFTVIISIITYIFIKEKELSDHKAYSEGKIVKHFKTGEKHYIKYIFKVNGKFQEGEAKVYPFKCDDGTDYCVGKKFPVIYSYIDPSNNEINLGKYSKFRPNRIRMFSIE
ncbi:conserved hypothetical protein [Tenacibaculum litoreum]|uniref:hypothetical protein n=1 Tax=Tenacibaculum TaxID=104267 RepID=UPI003892F792